MPELSERVGAVARTVVLAVLLIGLVRAENNEKKAPGVMRYGKRATEHKKDDDGLGMMRFGRADDIGMMRYGKRDGLGMMRYGRTADDMGVLRFGKRSDDDMGVMRFGKRSMLPLEVVQVDELPRATRDGLGVMRFGKRYTKKDTGEFGVLRFGKK